MFYFSLVLKFYLCTIFYYVSLIWYSPMKLCRHWLYVTSSDPSLAMRTMILILFIKIPCKSTLIQNNNKNIHVNYTGKTHENKCIIINITNKLTHNSHLSLRKWTPTVCIPSTFFPCLYHTTHILSTMGHLWARDKTPPM
jgi:hypothetical protein